MHPSKFWSPPCDATCRPLKAELQDLLGSVAKGCSSCCLHQEWGMAGLPSMLSPSCPSICPQLGSGKAGDQDETRIFQCPASCQDWDQRLQPHLDPPGCRMLQLPCWGWMFHGRFWALLCNAAASIFDGITKPQLPGERWGLRTGALRDALSFWQQNSGKILLDTKD